MYVIVDPRDLVTQSYSSSFERAGVTAIGLEPQAFGDWISNASSGELAAVDAFFIGSCDNRSRLPKSIRKQGLTVPIIVLSEASCLDETLELFGAGADDVVRKPVAVAELQARVGAIRRRLASGKTAATFGPLQVHFDGRDPEINGVVLPLPRRERRILEYLARNAGKRVSKEQIFNNVYGSFSENADETVVESHVSKLRKKLKLAAGVDLIDSKRFLGYTLITD